MGKQDSPSVEKLLKQVYAVHNSTKSGLQDEITKLKEKIASLQDVIEKCSSCPECGHVLIKSQNDEVIVLSQHENDFKKDEKDTSVRKNDKKESKNTEKLRTPPRYYCKSPSLFDDSWEISDDTSAANSTSRDKNKTEFLSKRQKTSPKLKQVTLDNSFCFAVENKQNELAETSTNLETSQSLLASNPLERVLSSESSGSVGKKEKIKSGYKYKAEPTRNRADRAKLNGYGCQQCKEYYSGLNLTEEELKQRMNNCSKHRDNHAPPSTPEHFWEVGFPSTQECRKRGTIKDTQYRPLKSRRKQNVDVVACRLFDN